MRYLIPLLLLSSCVAPSLSDPLVSAPTRLSAPPQPPQAPNPSQRDENGVLVPIPMGDRMCIDQGLMNAIGEYIAQCQRLEESLETPVKDPPRGATVICGRSPDNVMAEMCVFRDEHGVIRFNFVPPPQKI